MRKSLIFVVSGVLGAIVASIAVFVAADRVIVGGVHIAYGVGLAVLWVILVQVWLARYFQTKFASAGVALGWIVGTLVMGLGSSAGDTALPAETRSTVYIVLGAIVVSMGAMLPVFKKPRHFYPDDNEPDHNSSKKMPEANEASVVAA
ncbi:MAG: hypothetical protein WCO64_01615 [Actinomycetes bacterium]